MDGWRRRRRKRRWLCRLRVGGWKERDSPHHAFIQQALGFLVLLDLTHVHLPLHFLLDLPVGHFLAGVEAVWVVGGWVGGLVGWRKREEIGLSCRRLWVGGWVA